MHVNCIFKVLTFLPAEYYYKPSKRNLAGMISSCLDIRVLHPCHGPVGPVNMKAGGPNWPTQKIKKGQYVLMSKPDLQHIIYSVQLMVIRT